MMKQFLLAVFLFLAISLSATGLYFNKTWHSISYSWLESWARHML